MYEEQKNLMMNDASESSWSRMESDPSVSAAAAAAAAPPLREGPSSSSAAWFVPHTNAMGTATAGTTHFVGTQPPEDRGGSTIVNGEDSLLLLHSSFPSNSNTRNAPPPPPPTRTVYTHNSTYDKVPPPPPPMAKESQAQAQAQSQAQAQESWNTHTSPSPSSNHNNNLCGGFDPANLAWLQRMEEVATVWLNMLVQNQHHHPPPAYQPHTLPHNHYTAHHNKLRSIMDFCTRTLQQILSEGGFRGYTTPSYSPSLYNQPLPSLQDLPCMVVTLKYWYSALLSRCQHQTAIAMLPQRIFTAQHLAGISVPDHVRSCEKDVRQWLGVVIPPSSTTTPAAAAATTTTTVTTAQPVQRGSPAHAAVWVQQLQTKSVPAYSPVKPKATTSRHTNSNHHNRRTVSSQPPPMQVPQKRAKEGRMTSPTDVMMLDAMMVATLEATAAPPQPSQGVASEISPEVVFMNSNNTTSCHSPTEDEDQKPAAKFSAAPPRTTSMGNVVQHPSARGCVIVTGQESNHGATLTSPLSPPTFSSPTTNINTKEQEHRMRGLILSLYHACKCPYTSSTGPRCPVYKNCRLLKALWHHISAETKSSCCSSSSSSSYCAQFGDLCPEAESSLRHYGRCKSHLCSVCGPVLQYLPKIKQDILNVTLATRHHQAAAVEEAILQVVEELSDALMLPGATTATTISVPEGTSTKMNPPDGWTTTQPYHVTGLSETKDPSSHMLLLLQPPSPPMTMPPNASTFPTHVAGPRTMSATVQNHKKTHYSMFHEDGDVHVPQRQVARPLPLKKRCYSSTDSSSSSSSSNHHGSDDHRRPRHYDPPHGNNNNDSHHNATTITTTCIQPGIDPNQ
jgi:hypothetical protein